MEKLLICLAIGLLAFEYLRTQNSYGIKRFLDKIHFSRVLRPAEIKGNITAGTILVLVALLMFYMMPTHCYLVAFSVLSISDTLAALVGIRYGMIKIAGKSLEGAVAFMVSATTISYIWCWILSESSFFLFSMLASSLVASIAELYGQRLKIDDNALVPIAYYITYTAAAMLFGG